MRTRSFENLKQSGAIKSNQKGVITVPYNVTYVDITITAIDMSKVIIKANPVSIWSYGNTYNCFQAYMVNSTTLRIERNSAPTGTSGYNIAVSWSVTEYNDVKSRQEVIVTNASSVNDSALGARYKDNTITSVDMNKCIVEFTLKANESSGNNVSTYHSAIAGVLLTSNTIIRTFFAEDTTNFTQTLRVQVLEFN